MKISRSFRNEISAGEVYEMATTERFQEKKCRDAGALSWDITVERRSDDTAVVVTKRKLPTVGFPSMLQKFVPAGVTSTETIAWGPGEPDGSRTAKLSVDFHGAPASLKGTIRVQPDGAASKVHVEAEFKAHVPLIGGRIESIAAPIIVGVIDAEEATGLAWAAGDR